jgi:hypothetical protein
MYNTDLPRRADLPTSAQLRRSTIIALPSEYAVDPTGIGRLFGLTQMGEIKTQLAAEAAADAGSTSAPAEQAAILARLDQIETLLTSRPPGIEQSTRTTSATTPTETILYPTSEFVATPEPVPDPAPAPEVDVATASIEPSPGRSDETSFVLPPGEGAEIKLVMAQGARANFAWSANGSVVNFDTHGDGGGQSVSYEKGRSVAEDQGTLEAAFDGNHGWFWRNRTEADVTVTVQTSGDYSDFKRMK